MSELVKLKNGAEAMPSAVAVVMMSLEQLFRDHPIAAYELVMKCRDRNHKIFGNGGIQEDLQRRALMIGDGHVHESIRDVILSAVSGDGLQMTLSNPVA